MIKNKEILHSFNNRIIEQENLSHKESLTIFEAMYKEAVSLGIFNSENILEGIDVDKRIARAINGLNP